MPYGSILTLDLKYAQRNFPHSLCIEKHPSEVEISAVHFEWKGNQLK